MASLERLDGRVRTFGHELLQGGRDHVILGTDQRPRWDRLPGWWARELNELFERGGPLDGCEHGRVLRVDAVGEALREAGVGPVRRDTQIEVRARAWGGGHEVEGAEGRVDEAG